MQKTDELGNPQATLSESEKGWLAAAIECEGSVMLHTPHNTYQGRRIPGISLCVMMCNSDAGIVKRAVDLFHKLGIEPNIQEQRTKSSFKSNKTIIYCKAIRLVDVKRVLDVITPYFAGEKKSRAELILQFVNRRLSLPRDNPGGGKARYVREDWQTVKQYYELCGKQIPEPLQGVLNDYEQPRPIN